jgi:hypothetical protein
MTLAEAVQVRKRPSNMISHLLINDDATYSVVYHIVCEHCDYCDSRGVRLRRPGDPDYGFCGEYFDADEPHPFKENIYEIVGR